MAETRTTKGAAPSVREVLALVQALLHCVLTLTERMNQEDPMVQREYGRLQELAALAGIAEAPQDDAEGA